MRVITQVPHEKRKCDTHEDFTHEDEANIYENEANT